LGFPQQNSLERAPCSSLFEAQTPPQHFSFHSELILTFPNLPEALLLLYSTVAETKITSQQRKRNFDEPIFPTVKKFSALFDFFNFIYRIYSGVRKSAKLEVGNWKRNFFPRNSWFWEKRRKNFFGRFPIVKFTFQISE